MTARRAKQVIYGAFYLAILVGVGALLKFVFFRAAPIKPCVDCIPAGLALTVGDFRTFTATPGHYTFLARVDDRSSDFAAREFEYSFNVLDASGTALQSFQNASFIYAAQAKYLVLPNVAIAEPFDHADLMIDSTSWTTSSTMGGAPQFGNPIQVTESTSSAGVVTVSGQLTDHDVAAFDPVYIVGIFYDANNNPVGASQAQLDSISPSQSEPFSISYPIVSGTEINPALTKVYAYSLRR